MASTLTHPASNDNPRSEPVAGVDYTCVLDAFVVMARDAQCRLCGCAIHSHHKAVELREAGMTACGSTSMVVCLRCARPLITSMDSMMPFLAELGEMTTKDRTALCDVVDGKHLCVGAFYKSADIELVRLHSRMCSHHRHRRLWGTVRVRPGNSKFWIFFNLGCVVCTAKLWPHQSKRLKAYLFYECAL